MIEPKNFPFTKEDITNAAKDQNRLSVSIRSCWVGGKHSYYYVEIGCEKYQDQGKYKSAYAFALAVQKLFAEIENELQAENLVFVRKLSYYESGKDYMWNMQKIEELESVVSIVKIVPSLEFLALQGWLKERANFNLRVTDLYDCDVCQKRDSKSYGNYAYVL